MSQTRDYDSTVALVAGNILSGLIRHYAGVVGPDEPSDDDLARESVRLARAIVAEVKRTEPETGQV